MCVDLRIGLTGSEGVLGRCLKDLVKMENESVKIVPFIGDITNISEVKSWVAENSFDMIFHLAAISSVNAVERDILKAWSVNVIGSAILGLAVAQYKPNISLILASSSHVYKTSEICQNEESELGPPDLYGLSKLHAEGLLQQIEKHYGLRLTIARIFSFTSPYQQTPFFVPSVIEKIVNLKGNEPLIFEQLDGERDFLDAHDVARALLLLGRKHIKGIINICSGKKYRLRDIVDFCLSYYGVKNLEIIELRKNLSRKHVYWGDNKKLLEIGFEPKIDSIEEILTKFMSKRIGL